MRCSHGSELKSPSKMKLSYLDENRSQFLPITTRCFVIKVLLDCMSNITISFFLWLTLHKKASISESVFERVEGTSYLT